MNTHIAIKKLKTLPDNLQLQIFDYIDFLCFKHFEMSNYEKETNQDNQNNFILTDDVKSFLDKRIAMHEANPQNVKPWEEVINRIAKKHNYEL